MKEELKALDLNQTWKIVELSEGKKAIIDRYKAWLIAKAIYKLKELIFRKHLLL